MTSLHADSSPLRTLHLPVPGGHRLQVQTFGRADGLPALVLHGGPGSGCSPLLRRVFDPARYHIVCIDQRGAGASTPGGETTNNTTDDLLADLRLVRAVLGIERWLVAGGSWGAALAIAHAAAEPQAIAALLLRSSFLSRRDDIEGFFAGAPITLAAAQAALQSDDLTRQADAARRWWAWEQRLALGVAASLPDEQLGAQIRRYRVQSHYLVHGCWLPSPSLLERCEAVPRVPTLLLHGDADRVCTPAGALALQARLPRAELRWLAGVGHDAAHPALVAATVEALDHYARHETFTP